jgi:biopolymer transport protein ExbD
MRTRRRPPHRETTPNLAPMVDVVMVILIFFMLGTSFVMREGALAAQLPRDTGPGGGAAVTITPLVRIALRETPDGNGATVEVMGARLAGQATDGLYAFLREKRERGADPRGRIVLSADPRVRYRHVIAAFNACLRAGFQNVQFALLRR